MNRYSNLLTGCLCAFTCETIYGLSYLFTKQAVENATPLALLGWRFVIAAAAMSLCACLRLIKIRLKGKSLRPLLLIALFNPGLYFIGETLGIRYTTASESGVILACIPVASLIASALILHEKPHRQQVLGILVTLAGVLITVLAVGVTSSLSVPGYLLLLGSIAVYALYCVYVDKASDFTGGEITYVMLVAGTVLFGVMALGEAALAGDMAGLLRLPFTDRGFLTAVLYQALCSSVLGVFLSNVAIAKIGVNRTSSFIGVSTVVSILAGALILKEPFTTYQIVGAAVILAGIYIANTYHEKEYRHTP